jgi:Cu/Ag efflux protein CusF
MLRKIVCTAVVLALTAGLAAAADKKVSGKVKKVDADKGTITLLVGKKGEEPKEVDYKIADDVKFTIVISETEKKEGLAAKEGLKAEQLKEGASVVLTMDGDKVTAVTIGAAKKKK